MKNLLLLFISCYIIFQCSNKHDQNANSTKSNKNDSLIEIEIPLTTKNDDSLAKILLTTGSNDSLPFKHYWKVIEDSFNALTNEYRRPKLIDKNFLIIKGHFTSSKKYECVLQRTFQQSGGSNFYNLQIACIYSFENNAWKFDRLLKADSIIYIDLDQDSIYEYALIENALGCGDRFINFVIISLKNNISDILFQSYSYDVSQGICGETMSVGDILSDLAEYKFKYITENKPLELVEIRKIGTKNGWSVKNEEPLMSFSSISKIYKFKNSRYSTSVFNKDHIPDGLFKRW
jgi:hypothetical protein